MIPQQAAVPLSCGLGGLSGSAPEAPRELMPLINATNDALARQARLLAHQKRFVRDASHPLLTWLAVLKTQIQSAPLGDLPAQQALREIDLTVDGAVVERPPCAGQPPGWRPHHRPGRHGSAAIGREFDLTMLCV